MVVSSIVLLNLTWVHNYGTYRDISVPILFLHLTTDYPFASNELKLHHFFGILVCWVKYAYSIYNYDDWHITKLLYKTELSSFFYVFKYWLEDENAFTSHLSLTQRNIVKQINNALFYLSFFKFRIYDFTHDIMLNIDGFRVMETHTKGLFVNQFLIYFGIVGLYLINLYWFTIMTKILCKPIVKSICSEKTAILTDHQFTKYSYFLHVPLVSYVYSMRPNESYLFDIIGILGLGLASFEFHSAILQFYKKQKTVIYTSYYLIAPYFADQVSIHLRALLSSVTALYYSPHFNLILIPASFHVGSCLATMNYLYKLKLHDVIASGEPINDDGRKLIKFTNLATSLPIAVDILIIVSHSQNAIAIIQSLIVSYICVLILTIQPFYAFNHSAFHIFLVLQSYYLSKCNLR